MYRKFPRLKAFFATMAVALVAYGCDTVTEPQLAPEQAGPSSTPFFLVTETTFSNGYKMVVEDDPTVGAVEGVIDQNGGELSLFKHKLTVPAGAVSAPTTFRIEKTGDTALYFRLTATRGEVTNDIGMAGFDKRVAFAMSYAEANISSTKGMAVAWVKTDGYGQFQETAIDEANQLAIGYLEHFSDYALIVPGFNDEPIGGN
jgi:hypothetical protein